MEREAEAFLFFLNSLRIGESTCCIINLTGVGFSPLVHIIFKYNTYDCCVMLYNDLYGIKGMFFPIEKNRKVHKEYKGLG